VKGLRADSFHPEEGNALRHLSVTADRFRGPKLGLPSSRHCRTPKGGHTNTRGRCYSKRRVLTLHGAHPRTGQSSERKRGIGRLASTRMDPWS